MEFILTPAPALGHERGRARWNGVLEGLRGTAGAERARFHVFGILRANVSLGNIKGDPFGREGDRV